MKTSNYVYGFWFIITLVLYEKGQFPPLLQSYVLKRKEGKFTPTSILWAVTFGKSTEIPRTLEIDLL